ncbi:TetR family transcriptional regulator [Actinoplanes sp. NPDC051513]|uniref:TetR family transcriptional regulator n=1 Tax=Actinoplanes sp. NPDC051513 TaxID=3363908 RepID=UPI0037A57EF6
MKDTAKRAGISYTGLLRHFPRKEELLVALLEARALQSTALLESAGALDPRGRPP